MKGARPLIGVMEGRLVPPEANRIQSFPWKNWKQEFLLARTIDLDLIEMIFEGDDSGDIGRHPLFSESGLAEVQRLVTETGVRVLGVCADFFMNEPLHRGSSDELDRRMSILQRLIQNAALLGVRNVVLPCVDQASLASDAEKDTLRLGLRKIHPLLERLRMYLSLETDLPPEPYRDFLERLELPWVTVNYDTGNSAGLGYSVVEELDAYGDRISLIHIKDRERHGTTVPLGTGDWDVSAFFGKLKQVGYGGNFTLQAARGADDVGVAAIHREFLITHLKNHGLYGS